MKNYFYILIGTMIAVILLSCSSSESGPTRFTNADGLELTLNGFQTNTFTDDDEDSRYVASFIDRVSENSKIITIQTQDSLLSGDSHTICGQEGRLRNLSEAADVSNVDFIASVELNETIYGIYFISNGNSDAFTESEVEAILATCPES